MCNKCQKENCNCEVIDKSCKPVDAGCVLYNGSDLNCIAEILSGTSVKEVLEQWDQFFCGFSNVSLLDCVKEKLGFPVNQETSTYSEFLVYIQNWICSLQDIKVKVSPSDSVSGYLFDKIELGECLVKSISVDDFGAQKLKIEINYPCLSTKVGACYEIKATECIVIDNTGIPCVPQPLTPIISRENLKLSGINCNGSIQWYNNNNQLVASGTTFTGESGETYHAKCVTACGSSINSNSIKVPVITVYKKTRSAYFTKNDCGSNECSVPCIGTSTYFEREYTSTISQEVVNSIAENDASFAVDGQNNANALGTCTCTDCNCVFPIYNTGILVTNSTCNGSILNANGQILISGIGNANRFGYSVGSGDYSGLPYNSAIQLVNFSSGNIETTPTSIKLKGLSTENRVVFRLYNGAQNCFKDVIVTLTPPDCTQEQVTVIDTTVSCEVVDTTCKNWTIQSGPSGASVWYINCSTGVYTPQSVAANQIVSVCSSIKPDVVSGTVTENGTCI